MLFRLVNCGRPMTCGSGGSGQLRIKVPCHFRLFVLLTTDRWSSRVCLVGGTGRLRPRQRQPSAPAFEGRRRFCGFRVRREPPSANARGFRGLPQRNPEGVCRHLLTKLSESGAGDDENRRTRCSRVTLTLRMDAKWRSLNEITARQRTARHPTATSANSLTKENNEFVQRPPRRSHQIARRLDGDADDDSIRRWDES